MASTRYPSSEEWLAQVGWMRALARSLLADPSAAEDVVQETWIAALERPPVKGGPIEPWLARVVRNFAWKRRRSEARRFAHERDASAGEPVLGPAATAERLELQRTVLAAIEAIPEPFRTTVVERYLQGRSSADIARALRVPEGTVRWRAKRGLADLRRRLDARFGARDAWSALLVPLALDPTTRGSVPESGAHSPLPLEAGVLTMIAGSKIVLAAALGVAAVGYFLWSSGDEERGERSAAAALVADAPPSAPPDLAGEIESVPATRTEPVDEPDPAASRSAKTQAVAPVRAPESRPAEARLAMRFVDAQGAPWKDVHVSARHEEEIRGTSGADGRVELQLAASSGVSDWLVQLLARRAGCATRVLRVTAAAGGTTDLGDVLLEPGARVEGRVLDPDGVAVADARVGLALPEPFEGELGQEPDEDFVRRQGARGFDETTVSTSDAAGAFALEGIGPGRWRLWGHAPGMRYGWTDPFEVLAGQDVFALDVRLAPLLPTDRITGIVLDPAGEPLPSAGLIWSYELEHESSSMSTKADADGRFDLVLRRDTTYAFIASDPEHRYADAIATDVDPGTRELELRLSEKRTFEVRVRDREERPVEACRFALGVRVQGAVAEDSSAPTTVEPGLYRLALPARAFELEVEADGYLPARFDQLRPEAVGPRFEVVLDTAPRVRGRVLADGRPVANARVSQHRAVVEGSRFHNGFACLYENAAVSQCTSDAEGRFELTCESTAPVWLRAALAGWAPGEHGPLDPLDGREVELELTAGGSIEGRVLLPDHADAEGIVVGINHGDGHGRTLRAGPDGRFRFDHLAPGSWQVLHRASELDPNSTTIRTESERIEIEWSCTVEAGRTTRHDLDLTRR